MMNATTNNTTNAIYPVSGEFRFNGIFGVPSIHINGDQLFVSERTGVEKRLEIFWGVVNKYIEPLQYSASLQYYSPEATLLISKKEYKFITNFISHERKMRKRKAARTFTSFRRGKEIKIEYCSREVGEAKEKLEHDFGTDAWESGQWRVICRSWTNVRDNRYCDSYSSVEIERDGERIELCRRKFRDGEYQSKDDPDSRVEGLGIIRVTDKEIFFVVYYRRGSAYFRASLL